MADRKSMPDNEKPETRDEARITPELKRILEFPTTTAGASSSLILPETQFEQYAHDNIAAMKASYEAHGGLRSKTRYGWLRTRA